MPPDELDLDTAMEFAKQLTIIPGFPRFDAAIQAVAETLIEWCKPTTVDYRAYSAEFQAQWLVTEASRNWREWSGMPDLFELYRSRFQPRHGLRSERKVWEPGEKPTIECGKCRDTGKREELQYCDCAMGIELKALWGSKLFPAASPKAERVTQNEIERIKAEQERNRKLSA